MSAQSHVLKYLYILRALRSNDCLLLIENRILDSPSLWKRVFWLLVYYRGCWDTVVCRDARHQLDCLLLIEKMAFSRSANSPSHWKWVCDEINRWWVCGLPSTVRSYYCNHVANTNQNIQLNTLHHASYTCTPRTHSHRHSGELAPTSTFVSLFTLFTFRYPPSPQRTQDNMPRQTK